MKLLSSILVLILIGFAVPAFAEELYPVLGVPNEITVDLDNFQNSKTIIFELEFIDIEWVPESEWENTEFHQSINYENSDGVHAANMLESQLASLDGLKIETFEEHGKEYLSFRFVNLDEIIHENQDIVILRLELYSDTVQNGITIDELYSGAFSVAGIASHRFSFTLPELTPEDPTPAPMEMPLSTEEQMKLQQQQVIEQAEQRKQQKELEKSQKQKNLEKNLSELEERENDTLEKIKKLDEKIKDASDEKEKRHLKKDKQDLEKKLQDIKSRYKELEGKIKDIEKKQESDNIEKQNEEERKIKQKIEQKSNTQENRSWVDANQKNSIDELSEQILLKEELNKKQTELNKKQTELNKKQTELNKKQTELNKKQTELDSAKKRELGKTEKITHELKQRRLNTEQALLYKQQKELNSKQMDLDRELSSVKFKIRNIEEQQKPEESEKMQIANPASIHCIENGGISEIITDEDGSQYGICTLPGGIQCMEWKYFRGECQISQQMITETVPDPEPIAEPIEEKKCGAGTELKNGYCQVIVYDTVDDEPVKEEKGFFEWLMSLFGM